MPYQDHTPHWKSSYIPNLSTSLPYPTTNLDLYNLLADFFFCFVAPLNGPYSLAKIMEEVNFRLRDLIITKGCKGLVINYRGRGGGYKSGEGWDKSSLTPTKGVGVEAGGWKYF